MDDSNAKQSTDPLPMMDIIDPAFDGADGIDGDDLLQALSDHEDIMDFHDGHAAAADSSDHLSADSNALPSYQQMMAAAQMNANNNNNINNSSGHLLGTTIKTSLAPLEPQSTGKQHGTRGRQRRAPRRKPRSRASSQDAHISLEGEQPPLFGGSASLSRHSEHSGGTGTTFNDSASAASAPADLFDFGGENAFDPTVIPDVMDIQKMLIMRGLLDEGGDEPFNLDANNFQPAPVRRNPQMRRRTVDAPDGDLFGSQISNASKNNRPYRRRKTLDDPLSIFMADNHDGIPSLEELQNAFPTSNDAPLKRRKSEPLMSGLDFWDEGADVGLGNDGPQQMNSTFGNDDPQQMNSTFIAAAKEAFDSINRLKDLMNSGMGPNPNDGMGGGMPQPVTSGGMASAALQQQQQQAGLQAYRRSFDSQGSNPGAGSGQSAPKKASKKSPTAAKASPKSAAPGIAPQIPLPASSNPNLLQLDPGAVMAKLHQSMEKTKNTQKALQEWDRAQGLPKSHSQTMVNSSRSRKQLTEGVILKKWNGAPLLNFAKDGQESAVANRLDTASSLGQN